MEKAVLVYNLKNDRTISIQIQGRPFNITVIQVSAPTTNTEEAETDQFYETTPSRTDTKERCSHYRGLEYLSRESKYKRNNRSLALEFKTKQGKG